ncbi:MAG: lytic transglycosylase domain-containing protein [Gemmatimonadota bacterium]
MAMMDEGNRDRSTSPSHSGTTDRDRISNFPAPVKWAFSVMAVMAASLITLASLSNRPFSADEETFPEVPQATAALLETRLPMAVNEEVERWVHRFLGAERPSFEGYLVREGLYGGLIRDRLHERGMPEELLYLAMIESGFLTSATSRVSATGVWQFMGATARAFGLTVDYWVDERRDPVRATDAALDYLEELHGMFGSWYLAAAAYNAGPAAVTRALQRERLSLAEAEDEDLYWRISAHLPRETREYVPKILAATLLAQEAEHFGFDVEKSLPYLFDRVLVPGGTPLTRVAQALDAEPTLIRELNPHLVRGTTPPGEAYLVRVPLGDSHRLVASLAGVGRPIGDQ